jgi:predicted TIM-barrel fold metal-dependent hydrolase
MKTIDIHAHLVPHSLWKAVDAGAEWYGFRQEAGDRLAAVAGGGKRNTFSSPKVRYTTQERLKDMDAQGVDVQVVSIHTPFFGYHLDAAQGSALARDVNDEIAGMTREWPARFAGLATLPMQDVKAAIDELERAVTRLGFKGAMLHGLSYGEKGAGLFLDDKRFWPIYERAAKLDVPIYLHPAVPHKAVVEAYYKDYLQQFPGLLTAAWGFTVETATQGIRMVLSGVFDKYPGLKIVLGHLGESLPFSLWRIDMALARSFNRRTPFRDTFREHFWITTSGNFSTPALICCVLEMGADRIMFSIDYPFVPNMPGPKWFETVPLGPEDRVKILSGNAKRLLKL